MHEHIFNIHEFFHLNKGTKVFATDINNPQGGIETAKISDNIEGDFLVFRIQQKRTGMLVSAMDIDNERYVYFFQTGGSEAIIRNILPDENIRKRFQKMQRKQKEIENNKTITINRVIYQDAIKRLEILSNLPDYDINKLDLRNEILDIILNLTQEQKYKNIKI